MSLFGKIYSGKRVEAGHDAIIGDVTYITNKTVTVSTDAAPLPVEEYCGHNVDLDSVFSILQEGKPVVLYTWGGMGKTEFALKLVNEKYKGKGFFLDCSTNIDSALAKCASGSDDNAELIKSAIEHIRKIDDGCVIFDNVQSVSDAKKINTYFANCSFSVILTSRKRLSARGCKLIELPALSEKEAIEMFRCYHLEPDDDGNIRNYSEEELECVREIVNRTGQHTLSLELLAKTCRASGKTVFEILNAVKEQGFSLNGVVTRVQRNDSDTAQRFIEHIEKLFDVASLEANFPELIPVLKKLCVLNVAEIHFSDLTRWCCLVDNESLNELERLGWLRLKNERFTMHGIVAEALRRKLSPTFSDIEDTANIICEDLQAAYDDVFHLIRHYPVEDQAVALLNSIDDENEPLCVIALLFGSIAADQERYRDAINIFEKYTPIIERTTDIESQYLSVLYDSIAKVYLRFGNNDQALKYCQQALDYRLQLFGIKHSATAQSYNLLGRIYKNSGKYDLAFDCFQKALEIGEEHPFSATTYSNITSLLVTIGKYQKALEYCEKVLSIEKNAHGEKSVEVAEVYMNFGIVYHASGHYPKALEYYGHAETIFKELYGEEGLFLAGCYDRRASVFFERTEYKTALDLYFKALTIRKSKLHPDHPELLESYSNLANVYKALEDYGHALEYYKNAATIAEKNYDSNHDYVIAIMMNIAGLYKDLEDYDQAIEYYRKALEKKASVSGTKNAETAKLYNNIALAYRMKGDNTHALEFYYLAVVCKVALFGPAHPSTAATYHNIGKLLLSVDDINGASKYLAAAFAVFHNNAIHEHKVEALNGLIYIYEKQFGEIKPQPFFDWVNHLVEAFFENKTE